MLDPSVVFKDGRFVRRDVADWSGKKPDLRLLDEPVPQAMIEEPLEKRVIDGGDREALAKHGYKITVRLGFGNTRDVYEVEQHGELMTKNRVAKAARTDLDGDNATTAINLAKPGNVDENEVRILDGMTSSHPNIVELFDAFRENGKVYTVEERLVGAQSLEDAVRWSPIRDIAKARNIFSQIRTALEFAHVTQGIVHRDVKPDNILYVQGHFLKEDDGTGVEKGRVKLSDWQLARNLEGGPSAALPTKGGTTYTLPEVLNGILEGRPVEPSIAQDFYGFGATIYHALTGKELRQIKLLRDDEDGIPILLEDGRRLGVSLQERIENNDGEAEVKKFKHLDLDEHRKILRKKIGELPRQWRTVVSKLLDVNDRGYDFNIPWQAHMALERDLREATSTDINKWLERVKEYGRPLAIMAGVAFGLTAGFGALSILGSRLPQRIEPTILEQLSDTTFRSGSLEFLLDETNAAALDSLVPYYIEIKQEQDPLQEKIERLFGASRTYEQHLEIITHREELSKRLAYSLLRGILMEPSENKFKEFGNFREEPSLVPNSFVVRKEGGTTGATVPVYNLALGIKYLKCSIGANRHVPDIFASYLCDSTEEIFEARYKAGTPNYFPSYGENGELRPGYGAFLSPTKRSMIDSSMAFWYITDNEGNLHLDVLDDNNRPAKGLDAK